MAQICKNFNTSTNNIQTRITRMFASAINNEKTHISSLYGAIEGKETFVSCKVLIYINFFKIWIFNYVILISH